jgi:DNA-binding transcriptional ArsR family regulator
MNLETLLQSLKAAADPTRLRLLVLLAQGEATVGELQEILGQSQPRVSRHLRLLDEAGLVTRFRDGHWVYYRLAPSGAMADWFGQVLEADDPVLLNDREALSRVKRNRERDAYSGPVSGLRPGVPVGADRPDDSALLEAFDDATGEQRFGDILDIGCGHGALLCLLGARARTVVGIDDARNMRLLARSRVHQSGLRNCTVRGGDLPELPFADASFDLVVLQEALATCEDLPACLREATRVLRRTGRLIILDRIQPAIRKLPRVAPRGPLIESQLTARLSELGYKVTKRLWFPGRIMEYALFSAAPELTTARSETYA